MSAIAWGLGLVVLSSTPAQPADPWEVSVGLASNSRPETSSGGMSGRIFLSRKMGSIFRPELQLGTGFYLQDEQTVSLMRLGTRVEWPSAERVVPYLWMAFAHHHETSFEDARRAPLGAALGLSNNGEIHRSGLDLGVGVSLNLPRARLDKHQLRLGLRASGVLLLGQGPKTAIDVLTTIGTSF